MREQQRGRGDEATAAKMDAERDGNRKKRRASEYKRKRDKKRIKRGKQVVHIKNRLTAVPKTQTYIQVRTENAKNTLAKCIEISSYLACKY